MKLKSSIVPTLVAICAPLAMAWCQDSGGDNSTGELSKRAQAIVDALRRDVSPPPAPPKPNTTRGFRIRGVSKIDAPAPTSETAPVARKVSSPPPDLETVKRRGVGVRPRGPRPTLVYPGNQPRVRPQSGLDASALVESEVVASDKKLAFDDILFQRDSAQLVGTGGGLALIKDIAAAFQAMPHQKFLLEGHTCDLGSDGHNLDLSYRRANTVWSYLVREDARIADQVIVLGFGERELVQKPNLSISKEENEPIRALSRRVVIRESFTAAAADQ